MLGMRPTVRDGVTLAALSALALAAAIRLRWLTRQLRTVEEQLARAHKLRQEERHGRTTAEKRLRQTAAVPVADARADDAHARRYRPIGWLESCFVERRGTPRQGLLVPAARSRLRIDARVIQPQASLDGLEGFSHVWLLYEFHENTNASKAGVNNQAPQVRAKVHPPGLGGEKTGLFATRTPHRPNPLGLSVARLLRVDGDTLVLGGADLIEGTPILDVKPYLRHDRVDDASVPSWCEKRDDSSKITQVRFSEKADAELSAAAASGALRFYSDVHELRTAIEQVLTLDIRSVHQGRGQAAADAAAGQDYACRFDALQIRFTTFATHVLVTSCEPSG